jgi:hypothetical protein
MTAPTDLPALAARIRELSWKATARPWEVRFMHRVFDSARKDPANLFGTEPKQDWPDCELICELANHALTIADALERCGWRPIETAPKERERKMLEARDLLKPSVGALLAEYESEHTEGYPDSDCVGWSADGKELALTFGHVRNLKRALQMMNATLTKDKPE